MILVSTALCSHPKQYLNDSQILTFDFFTFRTGFHKYQDISVKLKEKNKLNYQFLQELQLAKVHH